MNRTRKLFGLISLLFLLLSGAAQAQDIAPHAHIVFTDTAHDFGTIPVKSSPTYIFEFRNTGNEMLVVTDAQPSCSCIKVSWSRAPVMPGEKGTLDVVYQAEEAGIFDKGIFVSSNGGSAQPIELRVRGNVVIPAKKKKAKH